MTKSDPQGFRGVRRGRGAEIDYGVLPTLIGYNLRRAQLKVFQNFQSTMAPFDVTPGQFGVLTLINENAGLSQSDLGTALGIDRSTMVAVIDRLESRDLVVRAPSPNDRRSYALRLSDHGKKTLAGIMPKLREHESTIAAALSKPEQAALISLLRRIGGGPNNERESGAT